MELKKEMLFRIDAAGRELMEEAGAKLISHRLIGAFHCVSQAEKPYRPHLPHPKYYRVVLIGEVEIVSAPTQPKGSETITSVDTVSVDTAVKRFSSQGRLELAELYQYPHVQRLA